jgi:hypothetical protein
MPAAVPFFVSTDDSCMSSQDSTRKAFSYGDVQEWSEQWHAHNCNTPILKKKTATRQRAWSNPTNQKPNKKLTIQKILLMLSTSN